MAPFYARYREYADATRAKYDGTWVVRLISAISKERANEPLPANALEVWPCGGDYFPHLIEDISKAQHFVHMQYYEWRRDELTAKICDVLTERVRAGVEVRILTDFLGSIRYKKDQLRALRAAGARVRPDVMQLTRLNYRNHRKIAVIDGTIGHTGGINIGQNYIDGGKDFPSWRDTGMRFTGPAVAELQKLFAERWYEAYNESLYEPKYFPPPDIRVAENHVMTQIVAQGVEEYWSSSTRAHEIAITNAQERVFLQSPYWVPDPTVLDAFMNAALSGVEVRFMMTGLPDKKLPFAAAQSYWERVLAAGGHIHLYMAGFLHAKSIVVDGSICAIGTTNLDMRSLELNKEMMVWIFDEAVARRQEETFRDDLERCREVTLEDIESWSALKRFRNSASRLGSSVL